MVVTTLRVPRAQMDRLKEIAATRHRSAAGEMRWLMDRHIAQHDEQLEEAA